MFFGMGGWDPWVYEWRRWIRPFAWGFTLGVLFAISIILWVL
jgi:hypothetical protein